MRGGGLWGSPSYPWGNGVYASYKQYITVLEGVKDLFFNPTRLLFCSKRREKRRNVDVWRHKHMKVLCFLYKKKEIRFLPTLVPP